MMKHVIFGGYEPQGSTGIVALGAIRSVAVKSKRRKNPARNFCRLRTADCAVVYVE